MDNKNNTTNTTKVNGCSGCSGVYGILIVMAQIFLYIIKALEIVDWSWWVIFSPSLIFVALPIAITIVFYIIYAIIALIVFILDR